MTTATTIKPRIARRLQANLQIRRLLTIAALTAAWCGLWQDVSFANIAGGAVLAVVVLSLGVGTSGAGGVRPLPLLNLLWVVLLDLISSTIEVAREILTPADTTNEAIVAVEIPRHARHHFLLLIVGVTLTPGTAVVDADPDTGTLYLHLLDYSRVDDVKAHVTALADLADRALPMKGNS